MSIVAYYNSLSRNNKMKSILALLSIVVLAIIHGSHA